jgi:hypothetical protein
MVTETSPERQAAKNELILLVKKRDFDELDHIHKNPQAGLWSIGATVARRIPVPKVACSNPACFISLFIFLLNIKILPQPQPHLISLS